VASTKIKEKHLLIRWQILAIVQGWRTSQPVVRLWDHFWEQISDANHSYTGNN